MLEQQEKVRLTASDHKRQKDTLSLDIHEIPSARPAGNKLLAENWRLEIEFRDLCIIILEARLALE